MNGARRSVKPGGKGQGHGEPAFGAGLSARKAPPLPASRAGRDGGQGAWGAPSAILRRFLHPAGGVWRTLLLGARSFISSPACPIPSFPTLDDRPPNVTVLAEDGTVLAERGLRRGHVRLDVLPPYLTKAVIATEDRRFYNHFGIDPLGLDTRVLSQ